MLPQLTYLGLDTLPQGWHRATRGLVEYAQILRDSGFAPSYAKSLTRRAAKVTSRNAEKARVRAATLERYVNVKTDSPLQPLGVADPQQLSAQDGALRIFSMIVGMPDLRPESRALGQAMVFINPKIKVLQGSKTLTNYEVCLSFPGIAAKVEYESKIRLSSDNHRPLTLKGAEAEIAQHELWHLKGVPHVQRAIGPLCYVPRELHRLFYDEYVANNLVHLWPFIVVRGQLQATMDGSYRLLDHERYL